MANNKVTYEIVESFGAIQEFNNSDWCIEVNKVSWNKKPPVIDIRRWNRGVGVEQPVGKGINITDEAASSLTNILVENGFADPKVLITYLRSQGYKVAKKVVEETTEEVEEKPIKKKKK
jgi:hypothetical protein